MIQVLNTRNLFAAFLALALSLSAMGCAQDHPAPAVVAPDTEKSAPANPGDVAPIAPPAVVEEIAEPAPTPTKDGARDPLAPLDASCSVDADCEVKDVGNCCGRMPACVNRSAEPDPAAVQRECQRTGTVSVCGFQEFSGCRCESGSCVGVPSAPGGGDVR